MLHPVAVAAGSLPDAGARIETTHGLLINVLCWSAPVSVWCQPKRCRRQGHHWHRNRECTLRCDVGNKANLTKFCKVRDPKVLRKGFGRTWPMKGPRKGEMLVSHLKQNFALLGRRVPNTLQCPSKNKLSHLSRLADPLPSADAKFPKPRSSCESRVSEHAADISQPEPTVRAAKTAKRRESLPSGHRGLPRRLPGDGQRPLAKLSEAAAASPWAGW